jgi:hypothetical protein
MGQRKLRLTSSILTIEMKMRIRIRREEKRLIIRFSKARLTPLSGKRRLNVFIGS